MRKSCLICTNHFAPIKLIFLSKIVDNVNDKAVLRWIPFAIRSNSIREKELMVESAYNWIMTTLNSQVFWITTGLTYLYFSYCLYRTARNCAVNDDAWWAFIPILQLLLTLRLATMPAWHVLIFFVPVVNVVAVAVVSVRIAKRCGLSTAWGVLTIIPVLNIAAMFKLAATKPRWSFFSLPSEITQSRTPQNVG